MTPLYPNYVKIVKLKTDVSSYLLTYIGTYIHRYNILQTMPLILLVTYSNMIYIRTKWILFSDGFPTGKCIEGFGE